MAFIAQLFDQTKREVARAWHTVDAINSLRPAMATLTDDALREKTVEFRARLQDGATLDELLPEAFAVVREGAWRVLGRRQYRFWIRKAGVAGPGTSALDELIVTEQERDATEARLRGDKREFTVERYMEPFDVQMIGGLILHKGMIAEMKTGEGKTLVAAAPLYLNALTGRGVQLVTMNDYLVRYQGTLMGELYHTLGMTTAVIQSNRGDGREPTYIYSPGYVEPDGYPHLQPCTRREGYAADILYTTNNEVGFDYLRDNLEFDAESLRQRPLYFAIVDEVDSILVDEARTPLIIAGPGEKPSELYVKVDRVMKTLRMEVDYVVDEKQKNAALTEEGMERVERAMGVENISDPENLAIFSHVTASLRANACYHRDVDYIVKDGEVIIVDEFTGRLMYGRRFSEGLHQAIEAKEGVKVERESQTVATITFQNYFRLYEKLSGMTGTAKTEEQEFIKIYGLPVTVVPTHRPVSRADHPDVVYKSEEAKLRGLVGEILQCESRRQPVLVGTRSIEVSERVSERLKADLLQAYALATILYSHLRDLKKLNDQQRQEFLAILKLRSGDVRREREQLEANLAKLDTMSSLKNSLRLVQPEEIRQLEQRLERSTTLDTEVNALHEKIRTSMELNANESRRLAEIVCFQKLEDVRADRLAKLMEASGLPGKAADPQNVASLAEFIGLTTDHDQLGQLLLRGIPHNVLNAKYHEQEAQIIAQAGRSGAVTIATNMAGRGIDIMLGGNPTGMVDEILDEWDIPLTDASEDERVKALAEARLRCQRDRELVVNRGGLAIVGTERHESRRIDNQLRGRSGRQGDPGQSRFYVSLQDELMRLFGPERFDFLLRGWEEHEPIAARLISKQIETAQKKVESHNFESRQYTLKYDEVMNHQRKVIYEQRRRVLEGEDMRATVIEAITSAVDRRLNEYAGEAAGTAGWDIDGLAKALLEVCPQLPLYFVPDDMRYGPSNPLFEQQHRARVWQLYAEALQKLDTYRDLHDAVHDNVLQAYDDHETSQGDENMRMLERFVILRIVNSKWIHHLSAMDILRDGIGLRGYAQRDPLLEFADEAFEMWKRLVADIQEEISHNIFRVRLVSEEEEHRRAAHRQAQLATNRNDEGPSRGDRVANATVGRNDPCPCGSGKKYKKCCMTGA